MSEITGQAVDEADIPQTEQTTPEVTQETQPETSSWFVDEGKLGEGDKPDWLLDKYKSVTEQAKSVKASTSEAQKLAAELKALKSEGEISDYKLDVLDRTNLGELKEDPLFKEFLSAAKESKMNQNSIDTVVDFFAKFIDGTAIDKQAELKKIGEGAEERLLILDGFLGNNYSQEGKDFAAQNFNTAEGIKFLEETRSMLLNNTSTNVPNGNAAPTTTETVADIQVEMMSKTNEELKVPQTRAEYHSRIAKAKLSEERAKLGL